MGIKKVGFKFKGKRIELEVVDCDSIFKKFSGLMFRGKNFPILLFDFKKSGMWAIHSFFCKEFIGVWLDDKNSVVEVKHIKPWRFYIIPKKSFTKLIEIPINKKNKKIIGFLDG